MSSTAPALPSSPRRQLPQWLRDLLPALVALPPAFVPTPFGPSVLDSLASAGWLVRAEPLLEAAGLLPESPAPQPGPDDVGTELEALRREVETLRAQVAQAERANAVLQGRIRSGLLALSAGE